MQEDIESITLTIMGSTIHSKCFPSTTRYCQEQMTIDVSRKKIPKFRLTHNQSFPGPSGTSVSMRVDPSKLPPITYECCHRRIIHYILSLHHHHQNLHKQVQLWCSLQKISHVIPISPRKPYNSQQISHFGFTTNIWGINLPKSLAIDILISNRYCKHVFLLPKPSL